jgi:osmoprotectant transport system substrate-binding protein
MRMNVSRRVGVVAGGLALAVAATACGSGGGGGGGGDYSGGSIKPMKALDGANLAVGSKDFDEQRMLGQMIIIALQAAGASTSDKTNIQGSTAAHKALQSGRTDIYYDYTGTGYCTYQKKDCSKPITKKPDKLFQKIKQLGKKSGVIWVDKAKANNTYALAVNPQGEKKTHVKTDSQYFDLVKKNPKAATMCVENEFHHRPDGLPGMEKKYGTQIPSSSIKQVATAVVYQQLGKKGGACNFGEVFTTDGRIAAEHLTVLKDDKHFFPLYNVALLVNKSAYQKYGKAIKKLFAPIDDKLTTKVLQGLNKKTSVDGDGYNKVASDWLKKEGFIG